MDNISQTRPHQFIGYWGYGCQEKLEDLLNKVVSDYQFTKAKYSYKKIENQISQPIWNVIYISDFFSQLDYKSENSFLDEQIASISASGIKNLPDAWVNIKENGDLILGREPFGKVPLYWTQQGEVIWFASRLQLLLPIVENPEVNIAGLYTYNCFSYVSTPLTPVNQIFTVNAGVEMIWQIYPQSHIISQPKSKQILKWRESTEQIEDEETAISQLQTLLQNAIHRQTEDLRDETVGVFLSGGLDSSVVAALLVQAGVKVRAYTLDFGTAGIPEYPYAEQVAEFLNIPLTKVAATPNKIKKVLISTVKALDMPFGDGVTVPLYLLYQAAKEETQIIFNGEGGDQLFAGWTNKPLIAASVYQGEHSQGQQTFIQQYLRTFHRLWGYEAQVYHPEVYAQIQNLHLEDWLQTALDEELCPSLLHRLRRATLMLKGAQNIHPRATNLGFAHGLFVRSPFCDLPLAQWTFHLSGKLCLQGACEKYILKRAVEYLLPPEIIWRQKRGMGVPLTSWCFHEFWHDLGTWLNPGILRSENRFYPDIAVKIIVGELGGGIQGRRIGEILWLLIIWEIWRVQVLGEQLGKKSGNHPFWLPHWLWKNYKKWREL
ncbi:MAG: asparagine synthetase B family protein [Nostocaceae cyanobacterium]|nr:asparagine synthetase B family protein [Nostocaceae cyanobacterium]